MAAKQFWSLTMVVLLLVAAGTFVEAVHGLGNPCFGCGQTSCTVNECFHVKDITDITSLQEPCNATKCIHSVVFYYVCTMGNDTQLGNNGCIANPNTTNPILVQTVTDNTGKLGNYACGANVWSFACPVQVQGCPCGVTYTSGIFFGGTPQGRCYTRPCDGAVVNTGGLATGRTDCRTQ